MKQFLSKDKIDSNDITHSKAKKHLVLTDVEINPALWGLSHATKDCFSSSLKAA